MKRALIVILLAVILTGCGSRYASAEEVLKSERFVRVEKASNYFIAYDKHTKVMYYVSTTVYNTGCLCPLYNADGTLMLWEGK